MLEEHVRKGPPETFILFHQSMGTRWIAWIDRHVTLLLLLAVFFALILGMVKLRIDPPSPEFNWENRWWQIALNVVRGDGYVSCKTLYFPFCGPTNQVTAMREPLPVLIFAAIARLTNESLLMAAAFGVLLNLAILVAIFYLTRELSNPRTGLLAALLWACYLPPIRLFYSQISGDLFACLGITCGLIYFLRAQKTNESWAWLTSGLLFGVAVLSRSAVLVIAAALTSALFFWSYSRRETTPLARVRWLYPALLFTFAWSLTICPWIIRNTMVFGRPVIGSTLSGYYLYRQNHILATDSDFHFVSGGEFLPVLQEMISRRTDLTHQENEAQMDQVYREEALQVIRAHPLRYLELSGYRFLMLWFNWGVNEVYGKPNTLADWIMALQHLLLLVGAVIGLRGNSRQIWPLVVSVASFTCLYMAVIAHLAYIVAVVPGLVVLTAMGLSRLGSSFLKNLNQGTMVPDES